MKLTHYCMYCDNVIIVLFLILSSVTTPTKRAELKLQNKIILNRRGHAYRPRLPSPQLGTVLSRGTRWLPKQNKSRGNKNRNKERESKK